MIKMILKGC